MTIFCFLGEDPNIKGRRMLPEKDAFKILFFSLLTSIAFSICSCASAQYYGNDGILEKKININTHLGYKVYDYNFREEICKSIGKLNVGIVRDYVFVNSSNTFNDIPNNLNDRAYIFNNVVYNLKKYAPITQVLGVLHDLKWEIDKDVPLSTYYELVRKAVKTYDGKTRFIPSDYGKEMSYEIKYWEICNEIDQHIYGIPPFDSVEKSFEFIKTTYQVIKETNPDAQVVFPGVANIQSKFIKEIFEYEASDGKRIWDYFDIFNFHVYTSTAEAIIPYIELVQNYKKKYGWNKPIWLSETGWTEFYSKDEDIAVNLPKLYLIALSCGIDKVFQFQFRRYDYDCGVNAFFGIIRSSLNATYVSLLAGEEPLSKGTGHNHILIKDDTLCIPFIYQGNIKVAKDILTKLQKKGLTIEGNDYTIDRISLIQKDEKNKLQVKFLHNQESKGKIVLPSELFKDCSIYDVIKISFKDYKRNPTWKKEDRTESYYSLKELIKRLPDGSSDLSLSVINKTYVCRWFTPKGKVIMAMWSLNNGHIKFTSQKSINAVDYKGNKIKISPNGVTLGKGIIYISGNYEFDIQ